MWISATPSATGRSSPNWTVMSTSRRSAKPRPRWKSPEPRSSRPRATFPWPSGIWTASKACANVSCCFPVRSGRRAGQKGFHPGQAAAGPGPVRQKEAALEGAKVRLNYTRIRATWDGPETERVVGERFTDEGDTIDANASIVSVVALDPLRAVIMSSNAIFPTSNTGRKPKSPRTHTPAGLLRGRFRAWLP